MTWQQLLADGTERLKAAGVAEAELDARYLLLAAFDISQNEFLISRGREQDLDAVPYQQMIKRRCSRIPLQYILGSQEFMGLTFQVDKRVLIPRQDTEDLVELILKEHPETGNRILDMCTGSGCIAVSLAKLGGYEHITAVDISEGALEVAALNSRKLGVGHRVSFILSDLYGGTEALEEGGYDIIISNPPYIPTRVINGLAPEVRNFEPVLALDGTEDGLYFYRRLAKESGRFLRPGGWLYLEIGYDQGAAVGSLLADAGYEELCVIKDTPGLDRIVKGKLGGSHV